MAVVDWLKESLQALGQFDEDALQSTIHSHLQSKYHPAVELTIQVPISKLSSSYELIPCKGYIKGQARGAEIDCIVACGHWERLQLLNKEQEKGFIHLEDHFSELVPKTRSIRLLTFQHGILNSSADFQNMGKSILGNLPEKPLCFGLYNVSFGYTNDLSRLGHEVRGYLTETVCRTRLMIMTFINQLLRSNPAALWAHIVH